MFCRQWINFSADRFISFQSFHLLWHSVENKEIYFHTLVEKLFLKSNIITTEITVELIWQNIFSMGVNFSFFHTVYGWLSFLQDLFYITFIIIIIIIITNFSVIIIWIESYPLPKASVKIEQSFTRFHFALQKLEIANLDENYADLHHHHQTSFNDVNQVWKSL